MFGNPGLEYSFVENRIRGLISNIDDCGSRLNFRCPLCHDSKKSKFKKRGNLFKTSGEYHCYNCLAHHSGLYFLSLLEKRTFAEVKKDFFREMGGNPENRKKLLLSSKPKIENSDILKINNPEHVSKALERFSTELPDSITDYLDKRKIFDAPYLPDYFNFLWDEENKRIVIPWYYQKKPIYYQYRSTIEGQPKYIFPKNFNISLFGLDQVNSNIPYIFLVESALDCIFLLNGIATGTINLSYTQSRILKKLFPKHKFVYVFDNPLMDETSKLKMLKRAKQDHTALYFIPPKEIAKYKDINETCENTTIGKYTSLEFLLENSYNSASTLLLLQYR